MASAELRQTHAQLTSSVDQLRQSDRLSAIGKLVAGLAHEIRNPLGSIEGAIDICGRTDDAEKRREFLGIIRKETNRLSTLLTTLLDFTRARTPQMRLVQVDGIVKGVTSLLAHEARQRGIHLTASLPADLPEVECDGQQIQQAFLNITLNALQATPSGGTVALAASAHDGWVSLIVKDDGLGVDTSLEQIFDPFFTTKEGGTGLGLAISLQILLQHGGRILAERNSASGMTFTLRWPVLRRAAAP